MSAISFQCKMNGYSDVTQFFVIGKMLTGLSRLDKRKDIRMPITVDILFKIIQQLSVVCLSKFEALLFTAMYTIAFFGFLRVGELVINSKKDIGHAICRSDICFKPQLDALEIHLRHSKTDQSGSGVVICIPATHNTICPVQAFRSYDCNRPNYLGVYFRHIDGSPVTRYQFVAVLKKSLEKAGIDSQHYKSHSFRIGISTSASLLGISNDDIACYGRWQSNAFKNYIRIPTYKFPNRV